MTKATRYRLSAAGNKLDRQSRQHCLSGGERKAITTGWDISRFDVFLSRGSVHSPAHRGNAGRQERPLVLAVAEAEMLFEL